MVLASSGPDSKGYEPHYSRQLLTGDLFLIWPRRFLGFAEVCYLKIESMNERVLIKLIYTPHKTGNKKLCSKEIYLI